MQKKNNKTLECTDSAAKTLAWVRSPEGKAKIGEILRDVERTTTKLTEARRVDEKSLDTPITM